jgi:nucleotide-binding universal stress UspA family protein
MQFNHILFATDFSEPSLALKGEVQWLANRFRSTLTVMHVLEVPPIWYVGLDCGYAALDSVDALAHGAKQRLATFPVDVPEDRVRRVFLQGDVAAQISGYVKEHDVDLIVMGTHGYGPVRNLLCGSALVKVLHDVNVPVWTAAFHDGILRCKPVISRILCAVELTDEALPLLHAASALAQAFSAQVRIVHAVPGPETRPNKYFDFDLHKYLLEVARVEICRLQRAAATEYPITISSSSIPVAVAEAAAEFGCDLVVIGRGRAQASFGRLRTHAYDIIRQVPCPVLSVISQDHTSSFCSEEHHGQFAGDEQPQIGCLTT